MPEAPLTESQIALIAQGKLAGVPNRELAEMAGVSLSTVQHAKQHPRIKPLLERLGQRHEEKLAALVGEAIEGIRSDHKKATKLADRRALRAEALQMAAVLGEQLKPETAGANAQKSPAQFTMTEVVLALRGTVTPPEE